MLVYLALHSCQQSCQLVCAFAPLSVPSRNPPCPWNSNHKYHPMPLDFQFKEPPLRMEFQKATHGKDMDIVWKHVLFFGAEYCLNRVYYFMSLVAATRNICRSKNSALQLRCCTFKS